MKEHIALVVATFLAFTFAGHSSAIHLRDSLDVYNTFTNIRNVTTIQGSTFYYGTGGKIVKLGLRSQVSQEYSIPIADSNIDVLSVTWMSGALESICSDGVVRRYNATLFEWQKYTTLPVKTLVDAYCDTTLGRYVLLGQDSIYQLNSDYAVESVLYAPVNSQSRIYCDDKYYYVTADSMSIIRVDRKSFASQGRIVVETSSIERDNSTIKMLSFSESSMLALTHSTLLSSRDQGLTWSMIETGVLCQYATSDSLFVFKSTVSNASALYYKLSLQIYRDINSTWELSDSKLADDSAYTYTMHLTSANYSQGLVIASGDVNEVAIYDLHNKYLTWYSYLSSPYACVFYNETEGYMISDNRIYRTTDGGNSWLPMNYTDGDDYSAIGATWHLYCLNDTLLVGLSLAQNNNGKANVLYSKDGGKTVILRNVLSLYGERSPVQAYPSVYIYEDSVRVLRTGVAPLYSVSYLYTFDSNFANVSEVPNSRQSILSCRLFIGDTLIGVGRDSAEARTLVRVYKSSDGGNNWNKVGDAISCGQQYYSDVTDGQTYAFRTASPTGCTNCQNNYNYIGSYSIENPKKLTLAFADSSNDLYDIGIYDGKVVIMGSSAIVLFSPDPIKSPGIWVFDTLFDNAILRLYKAGNNYLKFSYTGRGKDPNFRVLTALKKGTQIANTVIDVATESRVLWLSETFPNPCTTYVNDIVFWDNTFSPASIRVSIYNQIGEDVSKKFDIGMIRTNSDHSGTITLGTNGQSPGVYFIRCSVENVSEVKGFVIR